MPAPMFPANAHRYDPVPHVQVPGGDRRPDRRRPVQDGRAQAHDGSRSNGAAPATRRTSASCPAAPASRRSSLEQGLSHDPIFEEWANAVNNVADGDAGMSLKNYRRDVVINVLNLQGTPAITYQLRRAWVSEFQALPEFDANNMNTVGIQSITIQHEGFVRDPGVAEPVET